MVDNKHEGNVYLGQFRGRVFVIITVGIQTYPGLEFGVGSEGISGYSQHPTPGGMGRSQRDVWEVDWNNVCMVKTWMTRGSPVTKRVHWIPIIDTKSFQKAKLVVPTCLADLFSTPP